VKFPGRLTVLLVASIAVLSSCATTRDSIQPEKRVQIKAIKVSLAARSPSVKVMDHTGVWGQSYGLGQVGAQAAIRPGTSAGAGAAGGAVGGLVEGLILGAQANYLTKQSLGGDPDILVKAASDIPVSGIVFDKINEKLSSTYLVSQVPSGIESPDKMEESCALLRVKYTHGLAAYSGERASAAIDAYVEIIDSTGATMAHKWISSDKLFKKGRDLNEFAINNAEIYKADIEKASESIAVQVASILGMEVKSNLIMDQSPASAVDNYISALAVTCSRPYSLIQDCSNFSGAQREILIDGQKLKVAGTADGKVILVMNNNYMRNELTLALTLGIAENNSRESNDAMSAVEKLFSENGIGILKKTRMGTRLTTVGYLLELDQDGYSLLKKYSVHQ